MRSAFGVEHPGVIFKADDEVKRNRNAARTFGGIGATSAALGTGSGIVRHMESKGKDPMGFTHRYKAHDAKAYHPRVKAKILSMNVKAHGIQAKTAAGLTAASLGVAGAYKYKQKQAEKVSKARKKSDVAAGSAAVGTGSGAVGAGGYMGYKLGEAAKFHGQNALGHGHNARQVKRGRLKMGTQELKWTKETRNIGRRVGAIKGAGALAGVGVAGLGAAGIHHGMKTMRKNPS